MNNLFENDVEYERPKPRPPEKSADVLQAELMMWRARARENQAELRAVRAESAGHVAKLNREARNLRDRLKTAEARIEELETEK